MCEKLKSIALIYDKSVPGTARIKNEVYDDESSPKKTKINVILGSDFVEECEEATARGFKVFQPSGWAVTSLALKMS